MKHYDVVIAGGAMAGATLALALDALSQSSLTIAVVEAVEPQFGEHPGYDARSIALSYGTTQLLKSVKLWDKLAPLATEIQDINVSDRGHFGVTDITATQQGLASLGYVVELADVGQTYHHEMQQRESITLLCPAKISEVSRTQPHCQLTLSNGEQLTTSLLVAADGGMSNCCQAVKIDHHVHDFEQVAIIANVTTEQAHNGKAFERFTEHGPIALLPMSKGRSSLVWCLKTSDAERVMALEDAEFLDELQSAFGWRLGKLVKTGQRASYPLLLREAEHVISHRVAVVGNAAQTLHPIAGQGFNLGIRDVMGLAEEIIQAHQQQQDIGEYCVLSRYQKRRLSDRQATVTMTAGLVHIFSNQTWPFAITRNLALMAMDNCQPLKSPLTLRAMGLVER